MVGREHEEPFCAGIDYTECWTLELSIQDLDHKLMHHLTRCINISWCFCWKWQRTQQLGLS